MDLHIGIIPDGNRRYAKKKDLAVENLYDNGYSKFREMVNDIKSSQKQELEQDKDNKLLKRITHITFYVCSRDNLLKRPKNEIDLIHTMLRRLIEDYEKGNKDEYKAKINLVGEFRVLLPQDLVSKMINLAEEKVENPQLQVTLAIGYDGQRQIAHAFRLLKIKGKKFNDYNIKQQLGPNIDLVIRTGYEKRTSGFFPWQTVYAEWFFLDKYWPEIEKQDFINVIKAFDKIDRRFGK